jgi:hypothetical protein
VLDGATERRLTSDDVRQARHELPTTREGVEWIDAMLMLDGSSCGR